MLKIQIEIVNTGGSKKSLPPRSQKCTCQKAQKCRTSISSWLPCATHKKDYPMNRKVCSPTGLFCITDTQLILKSMSKKESKIIATQLEILISEWWFHGCEWEGCWAGGSAIAFLLALAGVIKKCSASSLLSIHEMFSQYQVVNPGAFIWNVFKRDFHWCPYKELPYFEVTNPISSKIPLGSYFASTLLSTINRFAIKQGD